MFTSFNVSDLQTVRQTIPHVPVGLNSFDQIGYQAQIDSIAVLGRAAIVWAYNDLVANPAISSYARSNDVDVIAWTVDQISDLHALMALGVTRIMTDISLR